MKFTTLCLKVLASRRFQPTRSVGARFAAWIALGASTAIAATTSVQVLIDADNNAGTGCSQSVGGQTFGGAEWRVTLNAQSGPAGYAQTGATLERCLGASGFGAAQALPNAAAALLAGQGQSGATALELSLARSLLPNAGPVLRLGALGLPGDALFTVNGQASGGPVSLRIAADPPPTVIVNALPVPGFAPWVGIVLFLTLAFLAIRHRKRGASTTLSTVAIGLLALSLPITLALAIVVDGRVADWSGASPLALDVPNDAPANGDVVALFAQSDANTIDLRVDVRLDGEPLAIAQTVQAVVGVPLPVTLSGFDFEGQALSFSVISPPQRGTLSGTAPRLTYTATSSGADSFSFKANDGGLDSMPAVVDITVVPAPIPTSIAITSVPPTSAIEGQAFIHTVAASAVQSAVSGLTVSGGLPNGVVVGTATGLGTASASRAISGTPASCSRGSYPVQVSATNGTDSANQSFALTVLPRNTAPSFTIGNAVVVNEDAGAQTMSNWITGISPGPACEAGQSFSFVVSQNTNPSLFSVLPAISANGTLTFTPAPDANGSATIGVLLRDDGGTANGGADTSPLQIAMISVNPVNDAPSFIAGSDITVAANSGAYGPSTWASALSAGPANESTQSLAFVITSNSNPSLFAVAPSLNAQGQLSFTPAAGQGGDALIGVALTDSGGTTNGGQNTSPVRSFTIRVQGATAITSSASLQTQIGTNAAFSITTAGFPAVNSIQFSGCVLPTGLQFVYGGGASAQITGIPSGNANVSCQIVASNGVTSATQTFQITTGTAPLAAADSVQVLRGSVSSGLSVFANNGSGSDALSFPIARVLSFGGGSLGGAVTAQAAGTSAVLSGSGGVSVSVAADGTLVVDASAAGTVNATYTLSYRIGNAFGTSDATVSLLVGTLPTISGPSSTTFVIGTANSAVFAVNGYPQPPLQISGCTLPSGLSLSSAGSSATVGGTALNGSVSANCILSATNAFGSATPFNSAFNVSVPPNVLATANPVATGGTVHALASSASSGVTLLTTYPASGPIQTQYHVGLVWDDARRVAWTFGADTHPGSGIVSEMYNAVDGWRSSDGVVMQLTSKTAWPSQYVVSSPQGHLYGSLAKTIPPAFHTYASGVILDTSGPSPRIRTLSVPVDHSMNRATISNIEPGADTSANGGTGFWTFDPATAVWTYAPHYQNGTTAWHVQTLSGTAMFDDVARNRLLTFDGSKVFSLSKSDWTMTTTLNNSIGNTQINNKAYLVGSKVVQFGGQNVVLYAQHDVSNLATTTQYLVANYPALTGYSIQDCWSAQLPDGRIVFGAQSPSTGEQRVFILDASTNVVTNTGHSWPSIYTAANYYQVGADYAPALGGVVFFDHRTVIGTRQIRLWKP